MTELKRTPLYPLYAAAGAKVIDFGGWELPVQFSSIIHEHEAVRLRVGLFDVSHMGEFMVEGEEALPFLQTMTTNDVNALSVGQAQYSLMCNPEGGVVDDLLVYRLAEQSYMLVVNAANIQKDWNWLLSNKRGKLSIRDISQEMCLLALQGPRAVELLQSLSSVSLGDLPAFYFLQQVEMRGEDGTSVSALVSRTGYTGEDGFELYVGNEDSISLWQMLIAAGEPYGMALAGLGARDTLRFEARLPLYGQELSDSISPLEAGLGYFVKWKKGEFIGRTALAAQKEQGVPRRLVGIEMIERGIPRTGYPVFCGNELVGTVTTGTQSPTLKKNVGLALVHSHHSSIGSELDVEIRGKRVRAVVVATPFYSRPKLK